MGTRSRNRILDAPVMSVLWLLVLAGLVSTPGRGATLCFEAEMANRVEPGFEIWEDPDCSGGRALVIRQGVGGQQDSPAGHGSALYVLDVPAAGRYRAWLRTRWLDECSNSVLLATPDGAKIVINDAVFNQWHWVQSAVFRLDAGLQPLLLLNREDGVGVDQVLLSDAPLGPPQDRLATDTIPGATTPSDRHGELELAVTTVYAGVPPKPARRHDVSHRVMAAGELPEVAPVAPLLPGEPVTVNLWLRHNADRALAGVVQARAMEGIEIGPQVSQPFSLAANSLTKVAFSVRAGAALPIAEHRVNLLVRAGGMVRRQHAALVRPLEWRLIGPFEHPSGSGLELAHPPEARIDLRAVYPGKTGDVRWQTFPLRETYSAFAFVDLQRLYGQVDWAAAYARTEIEADLDGTAVLTVMGDDMVRVWIDGVVVVTAPDCLPATLNRRVRNVRLTRGRHVVLAKICQGRNYWEFFASFRPAPGDEGMGLRGIPLAQQQ